MAGGSEGEKEGRKGRKNGGKEVGRDGRNREGGMARWRKAERTEERGQKILLR